MKLLPPENLVSYNGIAREARLDGTIPGEENPVITYTGDVTEGKTVKAGTYTASITLGEKLQRSPSQLPELWLRSR